MVKEFNFNESLTIGELGVNIAKSVFRSRYKDIVDYAENREMQKRGVDIEVPSLGTVEIKTDKHSDSKFYFELEVAGKPGGVDRCSADYYCILFYRQHIMYLIRRAELQMWLRNHWHWLKTQHPEWLHKTMSIRQDRRWESTGVVVPRELIMQDLNVAVINWNEEDEKMQGVKWE